MFTPHTPYAVWHTAKTYIYILYIPKYIYIYIYIFIFKFDSINKHYYYYYYYYYYYILNIFKYHAYIHTLLNGTI